MESWQQKLTTRKRWRGDSRGGGLFAGTSSGANLVAALEEAARLGAGVTLVTLMVDSGLKYAHTDVYR